MASKRWKQVEGIYASWFGVKRNPLSGRNNRGDDGTPRVGDILLKTAVVEIKHRRSIGFGTAKETRALAKEYDYKNWILIESQPGSANIVRLTMTKSLAELVCGFINKTWVGDK